MAEELPDIEQLNIQESEDNEVNEDNEREDLVNKLLEEYSFEELVDLLSQLEENGLYNGGIEPVDDQEAAEELASTLMEIKQQDRVSELEQVAPELSELLSEEIPETSPVSESLSPAVNTRTYAPAVPSTHTRTYAPAVPSTHTRTYAPAVQSTHTRTYAPAVPSTHTRTYTPANQPSYTGTYAPAVHSPYTRTYAPAAQTSYKPQASPSAATQQSNSAINYLANLGIDQVRYLLRQLSDAYGIPYKPGRSKLSAAEAIVNAISNMSLEEVEAISPQLAEAYNML